MILPYLAGRALNMHRFPGGAGAPGFWHKQLPEHAPDWVAALGQPRGRARADQHLPGRRRARRAGLGRELRRAGVARLDGADRPARTSPTYALIDIDPGTETSWEDVLVLARLHRTALEHLGVPARPKVTGRRGIQIWIPVAPGLTFEDTRAWVEQLSKSIGAVVPDLVSWKWDVERPRRPGPARLHPERQSTRRSSRRTARAPRPARRSPRRSPGTSSTTRTCGRTRFTIRTVLDRLNEHGDPFRVLLGAPQQLPPIR